MSALNIADLTKQAYAIWHVAGFAYGKEGIPYGMAHALVMEQGISDDNFVSRYGIAGDWEDPEDGFLIMIDVGELIHWVHKITS